MLYPQLYPQRNVLPQHSLVETYTALRVRRSVMRCSACVAELILMNAISDAVTLRAFEHDNFICSECYIAAQRVLLSRYDREDESERLPIHVMSPNLSASKSQEVHSGASGILRRVVTEIRGK
jgi:hypothetical protein